MHISSHRCLGSASRVFEILGNPLRALQFSLARLNGRFRAPYNQGLWLEAGLAAILNRAVRFLPPFQRHSRRRQAYDVVPVHVIGRAAASQAERRLRGTLLARPVGRFDRFEGLCARERR